MVTPSYQPRDPSSTVLYRVVAAHLETFLARIDADPTAKGLPCYVRDEFYAYLQCGVLAHGFLRLGCELWVVGVLFPPIRLHTKVCDKTRYGAM